MAGLEYCPHCEKWIPDLWDYFSYSGQTTAEADCPYCGKPLVIQREIEVRYIVNAGAEEEATEGA